MVNLKRWESSGFPYMSQSVHLAGKAPEQNKEHDSLAGKAPEQNKVQNNFAGKAPEQKK